MRISAALCVFAPAVFLALLLDSLPELFAVEMAHMCFSAERKLVDHAPLASSAAAAGLLRLVLAGGRRCWSRCRRLPGLRA